MFASPVVNMPTKILDRWNRQSKPSPVRIQNIRDAYKQSGRIDPIVVYLTRWHEDRDTKIPRLDLVNGRHRLALANEIGIKKLPTIFKIGNPKEDRKGPPKTYTG